MENLKRENFDRGPDHVELIKRSLYLRELCIDLGQRDSGECGETSGMALHHVCIQVVDRPGPRIVQRGC